MIALIALGNRAAGHVGFGTWFGVAIMTLGVFLSHPIWWAVPLYYATLWFWRAPSPRPWFHVPQKTGMWLEAFERGLYVSPFAVVLASITHHPIHLLWGLLAIFLVPTAYWLGFLYKKQPLELAELLAGCVIGII